MIEARNVAYVYPGATAPAVLEVSVRVGAGEIVGIVGPNGSGKSTLGRLLKGLLQATRGDVSVDGLDPAMHGLDVRRIVGLIFQNPNSQIVNAVVEHEVAFGPENLALPSDEVRKRVDDALEAVGLAGRETAECHSLSMADKQRIAIASVIAMQPRYLILDEPTAWLEPSARWPLLDSVLRWAKLQGAGLVLITHRMDELQICGRLYGMLNGKVEVEGEPRAILDNDSIRSRLALSVPEVFVLTAELRAAGLPIPLNAPLDAVAEVICRS
jgi:energy-coupling factor transport system ATP-binding protein